MSKNTGRNFPTGYSAWADANADAATTAEYVSMEEALEEARKVGRQHGKDAASWVFDGNTPEATYAKVLKGVEVGDPEVCDSLPEPRFGNGYTERELCDEIDVDYDLSTTHEVDQIADAYLDEARSAFWHEVEKLAREHLKPQDTEEES